LSTQPEVERVEILGLFIFEGANEEMFREDHPGFASMIDHERNRLLRSGKDKLYLVYSFQLEGEDRARELVPGIYIVRMGSFPSQQTANLAMQLMAPMVGDLLKWFFQREVEWEKERQKIQESSSK